MAAYFFGSSALVKRYSQESGTDWVLQVLDPAAGNDLYMARITGAEVVAAIARRGRSRDLSDDQTTTAIHQFRSEFASSFRIVEITSAVIVRAMVVAETYALRGYDAVQLAAVLEVNTIRLNLGLSALIFVSADGDLNTAATAERLSVENPNSD